MRWELYGFVMASQHRIKIVRALEVGPSSPKQISQKTDLHLSHVSKTLKDLETNGVVSCLTPALRRGRMYNLTKEGTDILQQINKRIFK